MYGKVAIEKEETGKIQIISWIVISSVISKNSLC